MYMYIYVHVEASTVGVLGMIYVQIHVQYVVRHTEDLCMCIYTIIDQYHSYKLSTHFTKNIRIVILLVNLM